MRTQRGPFSRASAAAPARSAATVGLRGGNTRAPEWKGAPVVPGKGVEAPREGDEGGRGREEVELGKEGPPLPPPPREADDEKARGDPAEALREVVDGDERPLDPAGEGAGPVGARRRGAVRPEVDAGFCGCGPGAGREQVEDRLLPRQRELTRTDRQVERVG